jgi:hypothetical protein
MRRSWCPWCSPRARAARSRAVVDEHADPRLPRERGESQELRRRDDLVGDEHVGSARLDERHRLVDLLAADADRAVRHLRLRDRGCLVRLRVRTQSQAARGDLARHRVDVALERVEVEDQRGRLDRGDRIAWACGSSLHRRQARGR